MLKIIATVATLMVTGAISAQAREYPIGGPVHAHDMEIAASYLVGIEMAPMTADMAMGADTVHLETDVHATADNVWGFPDGAWIPYLKIDWTLSKAGSSWHASGHMLAMTAKDGPHYANNVSMNGPGRYTVVLTYTSPEANGFLHHVDKETGVPGWWAPFSETFTFDYPAQ
jgi:periplasmic iron binding protein